LQHLEGRPLCLARSRGKVARMTDRPRPQRPLSLGAGVVVVHDGRVLLVRNIRGVTKGRYLLPAGRLEPNELPDQAAAREAFEETNLRVDVVGLLGVRLWVMDDGEHNYFFMFLAQLCSPVSDLRPNLDEIDGARFFQTRITFVSNAETLLTPTLSALGFAFRL